MCRSTSACFSKTWLQMPKMCWSMTVQKVIIGRKHSAHCSKVSHMSMQYLECYSCTMMKVLPVITAGPSLPSPRRIGQFHGTCAEKFLDTINCASTRTDLRYQHKRQEVGASSIWSSRHRLAEFHPQSPLSQKRVTIPAHRSLPCSRAIAVSPVQGSRVSPSRHGSLRGDPRT
jgi:hypothetical protein